MNLAHNRNNFVSLTFAKRRKLQNWLPRFLTVAPLFVLFLAIPKPLKTSHSLDFFMLYVNSSGECLDLDKEWYYNIVRSACCHSSSESANILSDHSAIKSKQCTLMLSSLDYSNAISIITAPNFKLTILKDCLLLGKNFLTSYLKLVMVKMNLRLYNFIIICR